MVTTDLHHHRVEWAELETIDLAKARSPEGRAEWAIKVRDAMHKQGFLYVVNHGLEKQQVRVLHDGHGQAASNYGVPFFRLNVSSILLPYHSFRSNQRKRNCMRRKSKRQARSWDTNHFSTGSVYF